RAEPGGRERRRGVAGGEVREVRQARRGAGLDDVRRRRAAGRRRRPGQRYRRSARARREVRRRSGRLYATAADERKRGWHNLNSRITSPCVLVWDGPTGGSDRA